MHKCKEKMHAMLDFGFSNQNIYDFQKVFDLSEFPKI